MIGFCLTDEQREFRGLAHDFAERTIRPAAPEADEAECVPWEVLEKAHRAGLLTFAFRRSDWTTRRVRRFVV